MYNISSNNLSIEGQGGPTITSIPENRKMRVYPIMENELKMINMYAWSITALFSIASLFSSPIISNMVQKGGIGGFTQIEKTFIVISIIFALFGIMLYFFKWSFLNSIKKSVISKQI